MLIQEVSLDSLVHGDTDDLCFLSLSKYISSTCSLVLYNLRDCVCVCVILGDVATSPALQLDYDLLIAFMTWTGPLVTRPHITTNTHKHLK